MVAGPGAHGRSETGRADVAGCDIVIVNWYGWDKLRACVEHARAALALDPDGPAPGNGRLVVLDNSLDPPPEDLLRWLEARVELVRPGRNLGFGAACNLGAARGGAPHILFLNGDAWPHEDALTAVARLFSDPDGRVGIVGGRMIDRSGRELPACWRFPTPWRLTVEALALDRLPGLRGRGCRMALSELREARAVDQVIGAFLAVRRDVFVQLDGFDTRFFLYYEEVDLCRRVWEAGFRVAFEPAAGFTHAIDAFDPSALALRLAYNSHSRIVYARKHWGLLAALYVAWLAFSVEPAVRVSARLVSRRGLTPGAAFRYLGYLGRMFTIGGWRRSIVLDRPG